MVPSSVDERTVDPIRPGRAPTFRRAPFVERVISEFAQFLFGTLFAAKLVDGSGPRFRFRSPAVRQL
jgi:hypothetical protein